MKNKIALTITLLCTCMSGLTIQADIASASRVELKQNAQGFWRFYVNEEEFPVRGAGGATAPGLLEQLKAAGGNCVRTWDIKKLEHSFEDGERFIDRAWRLGIMVVPGIWVQHERHGYDYGNETFLKKQREKVVSAVQKYKSHPAILAWGLGNEMEGPSSPRGSIPVFRELEHLAKLVKEEDPTHLIMSIIAYNPAKVENVKELVPSIDILGVNSYGSAAGVGEGLKAAGWNKPFAVTEFGVRGFWEVEKTSWEAPYEPNSQEKARSYYAAHRLVFEENDGKENCLGTFAFLWGWKQEKTATWFGMFLPTLEKLPQVDAMTKAWTGKWPENRCPKIKALSSHITGTAVKPGRTMTAFADVVDPEGDELQYDWMVVSESATHSEGGDAEPTPQAHPNLVQKQNNADCVFISPSEPGAYRLFLTVRDGQGSAGTANLPFRVEP